MGQPVLKSIIATQVPYQGLLKERLITGQLEIHAKNALRYIIVSLHYRLYKFNHVAQYHCLLDYRVWQSPNA
jgi:hypothetical protein